MMNDDPVGRALQFLLDEVRREQSKAIWGEVVKLLNDEGVSVAYLAPGVLDALERLKKRTAKAAVDAALGEALNSGSRVYKP